MIKKENQENRYYNNMFRIPVVQYISFVVSGIKVRFYYMIIRKQTIKHTELYIYIYMRFSNTIKIFE